jgi:2-oxoglutarate dehydrogenase E1 component
MSSLPITSVFNDGYIAQAFESFKRDPSSVDESWRQFFRFAAQLAGTDSVSGGIDPSLLKKAAAASSLVGAIQRHGHLAVQIDPLGSAPAGAAELKPEFHGITEADLAQIPATALGYDNGTAADVVQRTRELYCGALGYEFEHLGEETERQWFRETIEAGDALKPLTDDEKKALLQRLTEVDGLERFLGRAYVSVKRFSIEGVDALVPMLDEAIYRSADAGATQVVIGMAHRGRLNVLTHVMGKPYRALLEEFEGMHPATNAESDTGDVKYHKGYVGTRETPSGKSVSVELVPNPSHLEVVNPLVQGIARARQRVRAGSASAELRPDVPGAEGRSNDRNERNEASVLPVLVHGDASFAGEGIVPETLNMAMLRGYRVGGTLHIIANNQVGFTTDPIDSRSTRYASDAAKGYDMPIVHVNADDAESCLQAIRLAIAYRNKFNKDFVIDLVGYRRHGHNESDQPAFTQPLMYKIVEEHPTPRQVFGQRLVRERKVTDEEVNAADKAQNAKLMAVYEGMKKAGASDTKPDRGGVPSGMTTPETAVRAEKLVALNEQLLALPTNFKMHPTVAKVLPRRRDAINTGAIDWGHAEALAFGSLIAEGRSVRITGQDAERGTFSHRQAVLHDVNTGEVYTALANIPGATGTFEVYNSPLSETAVMGFEYGFSIAAPDELVLWEAQYGDFANVAMPIVDQFISAGRSKWRQESGIVLLLPHGYEGQGPEHSSARLERYLQLSAEEYMVVAYPSTPAQYFHILRRQALRKPIRPLVLMQPKSLLRMKEATVKLEELTAGTFKPVIDDPAMTEKRDAVQRLIFCTGKMYYDLTDPKHERPQNIAIVRIEELAPWPHEVGSVVDLYPNIEEVVWAQEEPKNMGAWTYVQPRLRASIGTVTTLKYVGRPERSSPAEGYAKMHEIEQKRIVNEALSYTSPPSSRKKAGAAR